MIDFSNTKDFGKLLLMIKISRRNCYGCIVLNTQIGKEAFLLELSEYSPYKVVEVDFSFRARQEKSENSSLIVIGNHSKTISNFCQKYGEDCILVLTNLTETISSSEEDIKLLISEININRDNYLHSNMFIILILP